MMSLIKARPLVARDRLLSDNEDAYCNSMPVVVVHPVPSLALGRNFVSN